MIDIEVSTIRLDDFSIEFLKDSDVDMSYFISTVSRLSCHIDMSGYSCMDLLTIYDYFKHHKINAERFNAICNNIHGPKKMNYGLTTVDEIYMLLYHFKRVIKHIYTYKNIELNNIGRYVQCAIGNNMTEILKYIADKEDIKSSK